MSLVSFHTLIRRNWLRPGYLFFLLFLFVDNNICLIIPFEKAVSQLLIEHAQSIAIFHGSFFTLIQVCFISFFVLLQIALHRVKHRCRKGSIRAGKIFFRRRWFHFRISFCGQLFALLLLLRCGLVRTLPEFWYSHWLIFGVAVRYRCIVNGWSFYVYFRQIRTRIDLFVYYWDLRNCFITFNHDAFFLIFFLFHLLIEINLVNFLPLPIS